jgi:hypothetical protein
VQVHGFLQPAGVKPQVLQNFLHFILAKTPGGQFTPHESWHCFLPHFFTLYFVEPGTHGQQALVPDEITMVTVPPPVSLQTLVAPIAPITVRGVAVIEPRITGGAYTTALSSLRRISLVSSVFFNAYTS